MSDQVKMRLMSQLIKDIFRVLQKLLKYFNAIIISKSFVSLSAVLSVIFCLNLNEALLLLSAGKLAIAPTACKSCSSLFYCHKSLDVFE